MYSGVDIDEMLAPIPCECLRPGATLDALVETSSYPGPGKRNHIRKKKPLRVQVLDVTDDGEGVRITYLGCCDPQGHLFRPDQFFQVASDEV